MAGFFSLGSCSTAAGNNPPGPARSSESNPPQFEIENLSSNPQNNPGVLLYRNEEIYQKGFEIWQQYVQVHHQYPKLIQQDHQQHHRPFLLHHHHVAQSGSPVARSSSLPVTRSMMRSSSHGGGTMNCHDCGNQAKKDCVHMRCRTCCKSRGFDCATHVKSTWVPAAQRRERQQRLASMQHSQHSQHSQLLEIGRTKGEDLASDDQNHAQKRPRNIKDFTSTANPTSTGLELGQHFPAEVSAPAIFRCVRVHSTDDASEQYAYQTAVNIGGRLFKGILYDQGSDQRHYTSPTTTPTPTPVTAAVFSSSSAGEPQNLVGVGPESQGVGTCLDPNNSSNNNLYPPPISAFLAGTQFFPPPRS